MSEDQIQEVPATAETPAPAQEVTESPAVETTPPVEAEQATETAPVEAAVDEQPAEEAPPEPKKTRFQERIDKLTADKYAAEREARALRERLEVIQSRERPPIDDTDFEAIERERFRQVLEEEKVYDTHYQAEEAIVQAQQVRQELFRAKLDAARDRIPDLDESIQSFAQLPVTPDSAEIIADSPKAAEIAHFLGKNPDEARRIASMSPAMQGRAIAQIENRVTLPPKRVSSAPPPPAKIAPVTAAQHKDPSQMSAKEYVAWRKETWNK